ncbi:MAG: addiction module antidote protein [Dongiaceae bacterium]
MAIRTRRFRPADYLSSDAARAEYINAALATGDPAFIADSLGVVARAKGMAKVARRAGLGRESLYKALSAEGNPAFATVLKVVDALGLRPGPTATADASGRLEGRLAGPCERRDRMAGCSDRRSRRSR